MGGTPRVLRWQQPSVTGLLLTPLNPELTHGTETPLTEPSGLLHICGSTTGMIQDNPERLSGNSTSGCPKGHQLQCHHNL